MPRDFAFTKDQLEELTSCPYCFSKEKKQLFIEKGYPYLQCSGCSLIYLGKRPKKEFVHLIYDEAYSNDDNNKHQDLRIARGRLRFLRGFQREARVHEDGAGTGAFVRVCMDAGLNATGNDLGVDAIRCAERKYNVKLFAGDLGAYAVAHDIRLDAFASFDVLSHLYEPWSYIKLVFSLLKQGGRCIMRTGNRQGVGYKSNWGNWSAPEHIFHYNAKLITRMAKESGFKRIRMVPAFDTTFPKLFKKNILIFKIANKALSYAWRVLRLPKDDYYFIFEK